MSHVRFSRAGAAACAAIIFAGLAAFVSAQTEIGAARLEPMPPATQPYRAMIPATLPSGTSNIIVGIPFVPAQKKLYIKFASISVSTPASSPNRMVMASIRSAGFTAFQMQSQGVFGSYQTFVATQFMDCVYEPGLINNGIYINRSNTNGVANAIIYIVGEVEI